MTAIHSATARPVRCNSGHPTFRNTMHAMLENHYCEEQASHVCKMPSRPLLLRSMQKTSLVETLALLRHECRMVPEMRHDARKSCRRQ